MNKKILFLLGGGITAIIAGAVLVQKNTEQHDTTGDSAGLVVGKNAIYVAEQLPSQTVSVALVLLAHPGFVVVHEDRAGAAGQMLGQSALLLLGETKNLPAITLSRPTKDGETLYVMLHSDDGDGIFDAVRDTPVVDSVSGEPVMMIIAVSQDASEPGAINP